MNCTEVRAHLPGFLYHELSEDESAAVEQHLTVCPACRREHADLERVRRALTAVPAPAVRVDVARLFQQAADRQARQARRWRRTAVALCGLAAALAAAVILRVRVQVEDSRLVLRWGTVESATPDQRLPASAQAKQPLLPLPTTDVKERLQVLSATVHALAADIEARDARRQEDLARLRQQLDMLRQQVNISWNATERRATARAALPFSNDEGDENP